MTSAWLMAVPVANAARSSPSGTAFRAAASAAS